MPRMNRPGKAASMRWNDSATGLASAVQTLTMLVPTDNVLVAASSGSTMLSSAAGDPPSQTVLYPRCSSSTAVGGDTADGCSHTPTLPSRSRFVMAGLTPLAAAAFPAAGMLVPVSYTH